MVVSKISFDIKICPDYSLTPSIEYSPYSTTFFTKSLITYFFPLLDPFSFALYCFANVRPSILVYLFPSPGSLLDFDSPISSKSPLFDMLAILMLEFLLSLPFWTYLPFALFTMCSISPLCLSFLSK